MDEWEWLLQIQKELLQTGHNRLAGLIFEVTSATVNNEHAQVDAMIPEAIALTRQYQLPWLEIHFRRWHLESRIWKRYEGRSALTDVVSLVEFAHREENLQCPLTLTTTYELIGCHGIIDGPGFAEQRKQIAKEALAKLEPGTSAFDCFSGEYAAALADQNKHQEVYEFLEKQDKLRTNAKISIEDCPNLWQHKIKNLIFLGFYQESLKEIEEFQKVVYHDQSRWMRLQLFKASALAFLKRWTEAKEALPALEKIEPNPGYYRLYVEAAFLLVQGNILPNHWKLSQTIEKFIAYLSKQGAIRPAIDIAFIQAELALQRNGLFVAEQAIETLKTLLPQLHQSLDIPHKIEDLNRRLHNQIQTSTNLFHLPEHAKDLAPLLEPIKDDPEACWTLLQKAILRFPTHESLHLASSLALRRMGQSLYAEKILRSFLQKTPSSRNIIFELGHLLISREAYHELQPFYEMLISSTDPEQKIPGHVLRGLDRMRQQQWEQSNQDFFEILALSPEEPKALLSIARNAIRLKDWELALTMLERRIFAKTDSNEDSEQVDWLQMMVATFLQRWDIVRSACARRKIPLTSTEGPIHERWEICLIQFPAAAGPIYAQRTGPVTATIVEVASPNSIQHFGDKIIIWPWASSEYEDSGKKISTYPLLEVIEQQQMVSFDIDGIHPGEEMLQKLEESIDRLGGCLQTRHDERYAIFYEDEYLKGIYAYVAVPQTTDLHQVTTLLEEISAQAAHPLTYLLLAQHIKIPELIQTQKDRITKYHLSSSPR